MCSDRSRTAMRPKPKKSLGQNFLQDHNIRRKIVEACDFSPSDTVIEIGPGQGAMTGLIAARVKRLIAVELDDILAASLEERYKDDPVVTIVHGDILFCDIEALAGRNFHGKLFVFGNIPYYITSPIIEHLFRFRSIITAVYLTVQKEFGKRIAASAGSDDYGSFSCFVQYFSKPKIEFIVKRTCFYPEPKVDSCFLSLAIHSKPPVAVADEELFFKIIRASFQKRRKQMINSVKDVVPGEKMSRALAVCGINPKIRSEELDISQFAAIVNAIVHEK